MSVNMELMPLHLLMTRYQLTLWCFVWQNKGGGKESKVKTQTSKLTPDQIQRQKLEPEGLNVVPFLFIRVPVDKSLSILDYIPKQGRLENTKTNKGLYKQYK
ncbi:hypothetical protein O181_099088 [Austropuccinia psidii MF-1]|uniref:Uncharacterized protein n=1 Tax=Austropuccinia psidii MF-1 TaxID=1389203 RepID=A0A9Q3JAF2_9BASI|nr:hypothetical protein [Austropuccinia psidii MF-1]